ncbi:MAG: hypothetical protein PHI23_03185 [Candidatus Peribacteraceae bacterium]|nr:hypothetical protein [Candidatus Peribacteraceae bacterium]
MYPLLALLCFVLIIWFMVWEYAEDSSKPSQKTGGNPALLLILGGILIAPFLALGSLLYALGRIAMKLPSLLEGALILLKRFLRWLWERAQVLFEDVQKMFLRIGKNVRRLVRETEQRWDTFLRSPRIERARRRVAAARLHERGPLESLFRLRRIFGRGSARSPRHDRRRWRSALAFLSFTAFLVRRRRQAERAPASRVERHGRKSAGERVHGRRFAGEKHSRLSSLYRGRFAHGRVTFQKVEVPLPADEPVLRRLRNIGWKTRKHISSL